MLVKLGIDLMKAKEMKSKKNQASAESQSESDLSENDDAYIVEKILDKRNKNGRVEYFLKWKNYPESQNTWEPKENLNCPALIKEFESKRQLTKQSATKTTTTATTKSSVVTSPSFEKKTPNKPTEPSQANDNESMDYEEDSAKNENNNLLRGFDRGFEPEKIIGATNSSGDLMFLMKWKNSNEADLVLAKTANQKCPQIVIEFYEERLTWHNEDAD